MTLGNYLKQQRQEKKLTQQNVADKCGVLLRTYQKWEAGERKPNGANILKLIEVLALKADELKEIL